jgi:hypothetical protein
MNKAFGDHAEGFEFVRIGFPPRQPNSLSFLLGRSTEFL